MRHLLVLLLLLAGVASCSDYDEEHYDASEPQHYGRVVVVYMSGDNNLSTCALNDLAELRRGSRAVGGSDRLLLFVDHLRDARPYVIDVTAGAVDTVMRYPSEVYASDPALFRSTLDSLMRRYPADDYGLVLWGHSSGWLIERDTIAGTLAPAGRRAYGYDSRGDQGATTARWMNVTQMARALEGLPRFRFIMGDCCCMLCVETAYELRHAADYLIGSPAEIPGDGAPYDVIVPLLFSRTDSFCRDIVDAYYAHYQATYQTGEYAQDFDMAYLQGYSVPLAVVDLQHMDALAEVTRSVLMPREQYSVDGLTYYFGQLFAYSFVPVMYDMGNVMARNLPYADYAQWRAVLDKAVPYRLNSSRWMTIYSALRSSMRSNTFEPNDTAYAGLSMFVPLSLYDRYAGCDYNETIKTTQWYDAIGWGREP